jgi:hypothetical protein
MNLKLTKEEGRKIFLQYFYFFKYISNSKMNFKQAKNMDLKQIKEFLNIYLPKSIGWARDLLKKPKNFFKDSFNYDNLKYIIYELDDILTRNDNLQINNLFFITNMLNIFDTIYIKEILLKESYYKKDDDPWEDTKSTVTLVKGYDDEGCDDKYEYDEYDEYEYDEYDEDKEIQNDFLNDIYDLLEVVKSKIEIILSKYIKS